MSPIGYELKVESKDFQGQIRHWDFLVFATSREEVEKEIDSVMMHHHNEVKSWNILKWLSEEVLKEDSHLAKEFTKNGRHSYYR